MAEADGDTLDLVFIPAVLWYIRPFLASWSISWWPKS